MDAKKLKNVIAEYSRSRKQVIDCLIEIEKRGVWKDDGFKTIRGFCREHLKVSELEQKSLMAEAGFIVTWAQMVDPKPAVQKRINALLSWRRQKAVKLNITPYFILTNQTLMTIAKQKPKSLDELAKIPGIGDRRRELHGKEVLKALEGFDA